MLNIKDKIRCDSEELAMYINNDLIGKGYMVHVENEYVLVIDDVTEHEKLAYTE